MFNGTMMQYFKYFLPSGCKLWNGIYNEAKKLIELLEENKDKLKEFTDKYFNKMLRE